MSQLLSDPPRWKDATGQCDLAERRAGHAVRCLRGVPPRPAPPLSLLTAQLRASRPQRRPTWILATAALILGAATMASAAHLDLLPDWLDRIMKPEPSVPSNERVRPLRAKARAFSPSSPAPTTSPLPSASEQPGVQTSPTPEPPGVAGGILPIAPLPRPTQPASARSTTRKVAMVEREQPPAAPLPAEVVSPTMPAPVVIAPPVAIPAPPALAEHGMAVDTLPTAPPPEAPRSDMRPSRPALPGGSAGPNLDRPSRATASPEARDGVANYLTQVIRSLRVERAPGTALRLLDSHDRELAESGFAHEALLLRVEALLALGRRSELLRLLDSASLTDVAASRALLVTRGELRAAAHRCAEGIGDFDLVLARSRQADRQALLGRALCRKRLGDVPGMRADIRRLRKEFPDQALPAGLE